MNNTAQGVRNSRTNSKVKSNSDIKIDLSTGADEESGLGTRYQNLVKQTRISTFGLTEIIQKNSKDFFEKVMDTGEQLNADKKEKEAEGKVEESNLEEGKSESRINELLNRITESSKKTNYFRLGLISEITDLSKEWIDDAQERGKTLTKDESADADVTETEDDSATTGLVDKASESLKSANTLRKGLLNKIADRGEELATEIESEGKIAELNWRKEKHQRQMIRISTRQKMLGRIGWAEKKDIEELNRKIAALTQLITDSKLPSKGKTAESIGLERRRTDRRLKQITTDYERRIYDRRKEGTMAA